MFVLFIYVFAARRDSTGARPFLIIMICCSIWAFGYAMSLMVTEFEHKVFWFNLAQIGP